MPYFEPPECNYCSIDPINKLSILKLADRQSLIRVERVVLVVPNEENVKYFPSQLSCYQLLRSRFSGNDGYECSNFLIW